MTQSIPITIPLLNPNEPGALLAALHVTPGQHVNIGDKLCTLETTKSTTEITAEVEGFVVGLAFTPGETIEAGTILCYLTDSPDWSPPAIIEKSTGEPFIPVGIRISKPASILAQQHNLDLTQLARDVFITEKMVQGMLDRSTQTTVILEGRIFDPNAIIVYGGGGHGKALIDLLRVLGTYPIAGFVDDDPAGWLRYHGCTCVGWR
jgi:pyruvate/2-oxoglutarate dehydrogenase complex dihydrolipoamide acyltransferase (E2) component